MIKKFILVVCGSFVGVTIALIFFTALSIFASIALFASMLKSEVVKPSVSENSILTITLSGALPESKSETDVFSYISGDHQPTSLNAITQALKVAADDKNIIGVYLDCNGVEAPAATLQQLRRAISEFKQTSKKFVYAYGNSGLAQGDYYVASVADSIFLNPYGAVDLHGLAISTPMFKQALDKIGIGVQIIRVGTYKSAVEPFMLDSISPANRQQQMHYLGAIWNNMLDSISQSRKIDKAQLNALANKVLFTLPTDSLVTYKLVDRTMYRTEFDDLLRRLTKQDKDEDPLLVTPEDLNIDTEILAGNKNASDEIAILYAEGEIDGSDDEGINSEQIVDILRDLQNDDDVKGLVLRVNSPGGSAFGSEQMWRAVEDFKRSGKTVAVAMGDYAASGGYYMSCGADRIFAEPTTVTGSIGIFGMIPNIQGVLNNKIGIHISTVKTNDNADFGQLTTPMTPYQVQQLQVMINRGYELFTSRCAQGRRVSQDSIKAIAEGRVWAGISAKKIGLVDELGGIQQAINWVAQKEKITDDYRAEVYTATSKHNWVRFVRRYTRQTAEDQLQQDMGLFYTYYKELRQILNREHVLCLMQKYEIN